MFSGKRAAQRLIVDALQLKIAHRRGVPNRSIDPSEDLLGLLRVSDQSLSAAATAKLAPVRFHRQPFILQKATPPRPVVNGAETPLRTLR